MKVKLTMPMFSSSMAGSSVVGGVAASVKSFLHLVDEARHDYGLKDVFVCLLRTVVKRVVCEKSGLKV